MHLESNLEPSGKSKYFALSILTHIGVVALVSFYTFSILKDYSENKNKIGNGLTEITIETPFVESNSNIEKQSEPVSVSKTTTTQVPLTHPTNAKAQPEKTQPQEAPPKEIEKVEDDNSEEITEPVKDIETELANKDIKTNALEKLAPVPPKPVLNGSLSGAKTNPNWHEVAQKTREDFNRQMDEEAQQLHNEIDSAKVSLEKSQLEKINSRPTIDSESKGKSGIENDTSGEPNSSGDLESGSGTGLNSGEGGRVRALSELEALEGNPIPKYDENEKRHRDEGTVILHVTINEQGVPIADKIKWIERTGHPNLDRKTLQAVKKWRFKPGQEGVVELIFVWSLLDSENDAQVK